MMFVPAGEIIGEEHRVRTVRIVDSPQIPDGEYGFVDMYCTDPSCDCRKTMVQVYLNGVLVSTINFGWEPPAYYEKWMGRSPDQLIMPPMHGPSVDIRSPDRVSPEGILGLFKALLDDRWIEVFKRHYAAVKAKVADSRPCCHEGPTRPRSLRRPRRRN